VVFSPQIAVLYPALEPLVYEANEDLQRQLCSFLTEYIFTADDNDGMSYRRHLSSPAAAAAFIYSTVTICVVFWALTGFNQIETLSCIVSGSYYSYRLHSILLKCLKYII